jgi:membrane-associated phospholipid phosphatase
MDAVNRSLSLTLHRAGLFYAVPVTAALAARLAMEPDAVIRAPLSLAGLLLSLILIVSLPWLTRNQPPARRPVWQAGMLFVLAVNVGYQSIGLFMKQAGGWHADALIWHADRFLLGGRDAQTWLAAWISPSMSDVLTLAYVFFLILLAMVSLFYIFYGHHVSRGRYWLGLMTVYGLGYAGYLLLAASGPYLDHPGRLPPLRQGLISGPLYAFVTRHNSGVDAWPSLHCAVTLYIQVWLWRVAPTWGRMLLPVTLLVILSTLYLQYHYFIDVLCGILLAWLGARIAARGEQT